MSAARTLVSIAAVLVGAAIGVVVGLFAAFLLWVMLSDSSGADEPYIGGLVMAVTVIVPVTTIVGGAIGWRLSRPRSA